MPCRKWKVRSFSKRCSQRNAEDFFKYSFPSLKHPICYLLYKDNQRSQRNCRQSEDQVLQNRLLRQLEQVERGKQRVVGPPRLRLRIRTLSFKTHRLTHICVCILSTLTTVDDSPKSEFGRGSLNSKMKVFRSRGQNQTNFLLRR